MEDGEICYLKRRFDFKVIFRLPDWSVIFSFLFLKVEQRSEEGSHNRNKKFLAYNEGFFRLCYIGRIEIKIYVFWKINRLWSEPILYLGKESVSNSSKILLPTVVVIFKELRSNMKI